LLLALWRRGWDAVQARGVDVKIERRKSRPRGLFGKGNGIG